MSDVKRWTTPEGYLPRVVVDADDHEREIAERNAQIHQRDNVIAELKRIYAYEIQTYVDRKDIESELATANAKIAKLREQRNEMIQRNCSSLYDFPVHANAEARHLIIEADKDVAALEGKK